MWKNNAVRDMRRVLHQVSEGFHGARAMTIGYEELRRENEELREEVLRLRRRVEELEGGAEPEEEGKPTVIFRRGRRKGSGSHYRILRMGRMHRRILFELLVQNATSEERAVPAILLRKAVMTSQGVLAGRISELINLGYVGCKRAKVLYQPLPDGSWGFRPETAYDPQIGARYYKKFVYHLLPAGLEALRKEARPDDDFLKTMPQIDALLELKKAAEAKSGGGA